MWQLLRNGESIIFQFFFANIFIMRLFFIMCVIIDLFLVVSTLNTKFRSTLAECKQLNSAGLLAKVGSTNITADKILYNHAIEMVR